MSWIRTDRRTDGRKDRPSYRDAWTYLKRDNCTAKSWWVNFNHEGLEWCTWLLHLHRRLSSYLCYQNSQGKNIPAPVFSCPTYNNPTSTQTLVEYNLPQEFNQITSYSTIEWKNKVKKSLEEHNKKRLLENCHKKENWTLVKKNKTAHIIDRIENTSYQRKALGEILQLTKQETDTNHSPI